MALIDSKQLNPNFSGSFAVATGSFRVSGSDDPTAGDFVFSTPGYMYNVHQNFLLDNRLEKTFLMFPSSLEHSVLPFYSTDQYRITLAGNIHFNLQNSTFPRYPLK